MAVAEEILFTSTVTAQLPIIMRNSQDAEVEIDLIKNGKNSISIAVFNINQDGERILYYQGNEQFDFANDIPFIERSDLQERICLAIELQQLRKYELTDVISREMMEQYNQLRLYRGQQAPKVKKVQEENKQNPEIKTIKKRIGTLRRQITMTKQELLNSLVMKSEKQIDDLQKKLSELEKQLRELQHLQEKLEQIC